MKILKKFLVVFCISFAFFIHITKANAVNNFNTHSMTIIDNYLNAHTGKTAEDYRKYILDQFVFPADNYVKDNYIIYIDYYQNINNKLKLIYVSHDYVQNVATNFTNGAYALYFRNGGTGRFTWCSKLYNVNTSGEITNSPNWSCSTSTSLAIGGNTASDSLGYILSTNYPYFTYTTPTWSTDNFSIDSGTEYIYQQSQIPINFTNGNRYNFNVDDYFQSSEPIIYQPQIQHFNGYDEVTYLIDNYTLASNQDGYFIRIINNDNGTFENISPDVNNINQIIKKNYYENVNLTIEIHDRQYNVLSHYDINTNINYSGNSDYSIRINSVSNSQKIVYYDYIINNNNNVKCFYSVNNNNFIEDSNCTDTSYTYFLQLTENGNIVWEIRDLSGNVLYSYSQNFIFNVAEPYINFKDNFNNNFLNLDVLINRYENNDIVEYSINNSAFVEVTYLEDYSQSQNIKYFTLNNINDNDLIIVRIKRNDNIITTARYRANYVKYVNNSNEEFNISEIFDKINISNINEELRNYIKTFGNVIINSKIGNLLILQTFCLVIILIIKMIKN